MKARRRPVLAFAIVLALAVCAPILALAGQKSGRLVVVMVWDGLRPDLVTAHDTPALYAMERAGVRFDRHHAVFPTLTMVNAAALATGAEPGETGIIGNRMYLLPALRRRGPSALASDTFKDWITQPFGLENSTRLAALNGPQAFAGRILGLDTVAQETEREGGYLAVVGKDGPTFLWDNRVATVKDGHDSLLEPHRDYLFVSDWMASPAAVASKILGAMPPLSLSGVVDSARDEYFTRVAIERAIPAARAAVRAGRPALIVLWLHNPDLTQHHAGLGTRAALEALTASDRDLARLRAAIAASGVGGQTDLIVVSDHGFATIRFTVDLGALLVGAGLKKSPTSDDVVVARNGGADLVYLSPSAFATIEARRAELQKIVDFAEAQEWCGPIFSRAAPSSGGRSASPAGPRLGSPAGPRLGWIDGTFAESAAGILNPARSPDLVISFDEAPNKDNRGLTGPGNPAFALAAGGKRLVPNRSQPLVRPIPGLVYADVPGLTTGMGEHGAAGAREIHNFCAAFGPDFRRGFVDRAPTANTDVAPTITRLLGLTPNSGPGGLFPTGRVMAEAFANERPRAEKTHAIVVTARLKLQGMEAVSTLEFTRLGGHYYLDGSTVERRPLGNSP
jgi:Type I phosphodiesterase / nucleotide pyrophosphatase